MPTEPGEYELRYIVRGTDRDILVRKPITITAVSAMLDAPDNAPAGSELVISWTGPDGKNDHLSVAEPGAKPNQYESYTYTRDGSPLRLQMPSEPGEYELRYIVRGTDRAVLVSQSITVTPVSANLEAEASTIAGSDLLVTWQGPDYRNDYLSIAEPGAKANGYESYTYAREGSPLRVQVPAEPGTYELRYVMQGTDRVVLERQTLTVEPVTAALQFDSVATAGGTMMVTWQGPDYRGDYIAISRIGDKGHETYARTSDGSPLTIKVPEAAGDYELRYVMNLDRTVIERVPLTVQ